MYIIFKRFYLYKTFLIFVTANDLSFWYFAYFLEKKNICLNILFIFHCRFLLVLFGDQFSGVLLHALLLSNFFRVLSLLNTSILFRDDLHITWGGREVSEVLTSLKMGMHKNVRSEKHKNVRKKCIKMSEGRGRVKKLTKIYLKLINFCTDKISQSVTSVDFCVV